MKEVRGRKYFLRSKKAERPATFLRSSYFDAREPEGIDNMEQIQNQSHNRDSCTSSVKKMIT